MNPSPVGANRAVSPDAMGASLRAALGAIEGLYPAGGSPEELAAAIDSLPAAERGKLVDLFNVAARLQSLVAPLALRAGEVATGCEPADWMRYRLQDPVRLLRNDPRNVQLWTASTGGATGVSDLLTQISGSTKFLVASGVTNRPWATAEFSKGRQSVHGVNKENAILLASQSWLNVEGDLWRGQRQSRPQFPFPVGVGATADIASEGPLNPEVQQMWGAVRTFDGVYTYHVQFQQGRGQADRAWQNSMAKLLVVNALLAALDLPQVPLATDRLVSDHLVGNPEGPGAVLKLERFQVTAAEVAAQLARNGGLLLMHANGTFATPDEVQALTHKRMTLFPGSFNPLHLGHETAAYAGYLKNPEGGVYLEISKTHCHKPPITDADIAARLSGNVGLFPFIITSAPLFSDKIEVFKNVKDMIVGWDTADWTISPKGYRTVGDSHEAQERACLESLRELESRDARFLVLGRDGYTVKDLVCPIWFAPRLVDLEAEQVAISSSELRQIAEGHSQGSR